MKIKNAFSISLSKFSLMYKTMLFLLVLILIITFLSMGAISPILSGLRGDIKNLKIGESLGNYMKGMFSGGNAEVEFQAFMDSILGLKNIVDNFSTQITIAVIVFILMIFIATLIVYMAFYSISDIIHTFMSSNSKFGFVSNFIYNIKKSFSFAIVYAPIAILMFIVGISIALGMGALMGKIHPIVGMFTTYLVVWALIAIRRALFIYVVPIMVVDGLTISQAIVKNFEYLKGNFARIFGAYLLIYLFSMMVTILCSLITLGVALLLAVSGVIVIMNVTDCVEYYHIRGLKYYIDEQTVINPNKKFKDAIADEDTFSL